MKTQILTFISCALYSIMGMAQTQESISLQAGYTHQSYYSLENGEVKNVDNSTWDLAFSTGGTASTIRINTGTEVFVYPNSINDWATLDTTGISGWTKAYDADTSWDVGAFSYGSDNSFNLGWGTYNLSTHHVVGTKLYVLKLVNGSYKKVWIEKLASGTYTFKHADLDHQNEQTATIKKTDYTSKNFVYFSLANNTVLDREPATTDWDIVFTKYTSEIAPATFYGVTGALVNKNLSVSKAEKVNTTTAQQGVFDAKINAIGYDWKTLNYTTFQYNVEDSLVYFVNDQTGNVWKLIFESFEGSATGNIKFSKEKLQIANLLNPTTTEGLTVFPNPANAHNATIRFEAALNETYQITIQNAVGTQVYQHEIESKIGTNTLPLNTLNLAKGLYFIQLSTPNSLEQIKFFVH